MWRLLGAVLVLLAGVAADAARVEAAGMYRGGAVLIIDGQQRVLREGDTSPEGCRLISATAQGCTVQCRGGPVLRLSLSNRAGGGYAPLRRPVVRVPADVRGQYRVQGSIDGRPVEMLVDTGASVMAMSALQAASLGIEVPRNAPEGLVSTAQGKARARQVMLPDVRVGGIKVPNVRAVVVDGAFPETILLGMSFLQSVQIEHAAGTMVLRGH